MQESRIYNFSSIFLIALGLTLGRIYYLQISDLGLFFDEAQYWTWAKDFSFGYYSKPPIIAWLIMATTNFCGDGEACIRIGGPILHFFTSLLVYLIGKDLFGPKTGFWSGITYATIPAVTVSSSFISTDVPLIFFWALGFYAFIRAMENHGNRWWIIAGIACGLGMLSKYTMIIFFICSYLYLASSKTYREYLVSFSFWGAVAMAGLIFTPNILWNYSNDFVSFSHTGDNVLSHDIALYPTKTLEFLGGQFAIFGPILFTVLLATLFSLRSSLESDSKKVLVIFTFILIIIAIIVSLISGAQAHWIAPAYIAGTVLVTNYLIERNKVILLQISIILHILAAVSFYHYDTIASRFDIKLDPFARLKTWNILANNVSKELHKYPNVFVVSDERKIVAQTMYALRSKDGRPYPVVKWNADKITHDHYDLTTDMNHYIGKDFLLVTRTPSLKHFSPYFRSATRVKDIDIRGKKFSLNYLQSFKGY